MPLQPVRGKFGTSKRGLGTNIVKKGGIVSVAKAAIKVKTKGARDKRQRI